ncbi:UNKNOWN [Stylonychia lemnae]|uniref:Uncharacterized protein n=1 Tax=Stylonychia lemnae TaxID=5949 RepID=A0A078AEF0_STYLE|nr:UNKNOWN [Stylonychia lemnae]|eukprot:CDW79293.1 UNKNOWN [Stylonychia lemnae]
MRTRFAKTVTKGAKETMEKFKTELESSQYAKSLTANNFALPPVFQKKEMRIQLLEIKGKLEFDANKYHNQRYNDLLKKVVNYRVEFQKMKDSSARKELAKEEFDAWMNYLNGRKQDMPMPDYDINQKDLSLLKENFDRFKDRKTHRIASDQMTDFHHNFAKKFKFTVPVHPKNLQQMIHPHFGYITSFKNRGFTFEELESLYRNQIVSSYERFLGQELLADELSCLSYWLLVDDNKKGYFNLNQLEKLLQVINNQSQQFLTGLQI